MATTGMTRKDFELVAAAIAESEVLDSGRRRSFACDMADRLLATSDSFDPVRFVATCIPTDEPQPSISTLTDEVSEWTHGLGLRVTSLAARRHQTASGSRN